METGWGSRCWLQGCGGQRAWSEPPVGLSIHGHVRAHGELGLLTRAAVGSSVLPPGFSFSLGFASGGRQTAHILKGEIISLLPVLGKMIRSQKCLLVTPFVERHFGTTRWKNQNAFHETICVQYAS